MVETPRLWTWGTLMLGEDGRAIEDQARLAEAAGWDGLVYSDSQNLFMDTFVGMTLAARSSTTLRLSTGVTNPYTRHPAVMANLAATLQSLSGGRIELGIGRGDSALAHLGRAPVPLKVLESYVGVVKDHLRSIDVPFEAISRFNSDGAPQASDILEMSDTPQVSRLEWIDHGQPPVPIDVVASGPRTIAVGGRVGDSVSLTVGADRARIEWGMSIARSARESVRLDPSTLPIGVYLNVVAHPDRDVAHRLARANIAGVARFSVMQGAAAGPVTPVEAVVLSKLRHAYDMNDHGKITAGHGTVITEEFADNYGVVGGPEHCVDRIGSLMDLGVSKFVLMPARPRIPAHLETDPDVRVSNQCLVDQVLPALLSMFATDRSGSTE